MKKSCGNCGRPATHSAGGINRCDRCQDEPNKRYRVSIDFYFDAEDESEAIGIADSIAEYAEKSDMVEIEARVNDPEEVVD